MSSRDPFAGTARFCHRISPSGEITRPGGRCSRPKVEMVGLRTYTSQSKILPEQTIGRGLRRMFRGDDSVTEYVSVVGTDAFMEFVESIKPEGVELSYVTMARP
jgi:hypothetical protein